MGRTTLALHCLPALPPLFPSYIPSSLLPNLILLSFLPFIPLLAYLSFTFLLSVPPCVSVSLHACPPEPRLHPRSPVAASTRWSCSEVVRGATDDTREITDSEVRPETRNEAGTKPVTLFHVLNTPLVE